MTRFDRDWHARFDRDQRRFDRLFWPMFTIAAIIGVAFLVAYLTLIITGVNWLWSVTP